MLNTACKTGFICRNAIDHFELAKLKRDFCGETCGVDRNLSNCIILNVKYFGL